MNKNRILYAIIIVLFSFSLYIGINYLLLISQQENISTAKDNTPIIESGSISGEENIISEQSEDDIKNLQKKQVLTKISGKEASFQESNTAIQNISVNLENNSFDYFPVELGPVLSGFLMFQFITDIGQCDTLGVDYNILEGDRDNFKTQCQYIYYLKNTLINKGNYEVPKNILEKNDFLRNIHGNIQGDWFSDFILKTSGNDTREGFYELSKEQNLEVSEVSVVHFGFAAFYDDISSYTLEKASSTIYDKTLFFKAVYENEVSICNEIGSEGYVTYCTDYFDVSQQQKYKDIFEGFIQTLYASI